jgi:hypothetical protein
MITMGGGGGVEEAANPRLAAPPLRVFAEAQQTMGAPPSPRMLVRVFIITMKYSFIVGL